MPQIKPSPAPIPVEAERSSSIHLVNLTASPGSSTVVPVLTAPRMNSRKSKHIRESERVGTLALAGAALIAPAVWIGHAVLVWMDIL